MSPLGEASRVMTTGNAKKWYAIHTYSGFEAKVRDALRQRVAQHSMEERFGEILLPSETTTEARPGGKMRGSVGHLYRESEAT